jgi:hypothetical protein
VCANSNEEKVLVESLDILHNQIRVFKQRSIKFPQKHQLTNHWEEMVQANHTLP